MYNVIYEINNGTIKVIVLLRKTYCVTKKRKINFAFRFHHYRKI